MRRALILLAGVTLMVAGCKSSNSEPKENEVEVTLDQVPPAVKDTLTRESGGAPVGKIEREYEKGKVLYSAMITKGGKTWEFEVDESGTVVEREEAGKEDRED
jgi:hypothetical protein